LGTAVDHLFRDEGTSTWSVAASLSDAVSRTSALTVAIGDTLYLIGGIDRGTPTARVDVFSGL